ncbi:YqcI/YcgG family protein [Bdellovibrio reynosensis]|uniref:YqcI/YcgG family protein n=2 Tax=Bdellovibrio reynosensis TaxID=2835041 RepID=A0ABY4CAJ1_9BACT|nr:guanitoxin biosynthesis heme-dependent pre-guanitoxin N-hydroxylase GntA [Bdellovibrio reynosensis]UOF01789.1 YqcI/YcgG family protein [Bdellovibrio reynosensis]
MNLQEIENDLRALVSQKNYPCVAAVKAFHDGDFIFDTYSKFGTGESAQRLAQNLLSFKEKQSKPGGEYLTYIAVFPEDQSTDEHTFEMHLFHELSAIWNFPEIAGKWDEKFSSNPDDKNFCFSLDGSAFFVVGMHPQSSRRARRLPYNALIFNLYSQFQVLREKGVFDSMVKSIRHRDMQFQGSVNPMVEQYDNKWEAIQYSGKMNPPDWKCPFSRNKT